jgi:hypothetical protein
VKGIQGDQFGFPAVIFAFWFCERNFSGQKNPAPVGGFQLSMNLIEIWCGLPIPGCDIVVLVQ